MKASGLRAPPLSWVVGVRARARGEARGTRLAAWCGSAVGLPLRTDDDYILIYTMCLRLRIVIYLSLGLRAEAM
jgi:hypothetical protein